MPLPFCRACVEMVVYESGSFVADKPEYAQYLCQGGGADIVECQAGKNGAVKIMKPGFYSEDASLLQARGQV